MMWVHNLGGGQIFSLVGKCSLPPPKKNSTSEREDVCWDSSLPLPTGWVPIPCPITQMQAQLMVAALPPCPGHIPDMTPTQLLDSSRARDSLVCLILFMATIWSVCGCSTH